MNHLNERINSNHNKLLQQYPYDSKHSSSLQTGREWNSHCKYLPPQVGIEISDWLRPQTYRSYQMDKLVLEGVPSESEHKEYMLSYQQWAKLHRQELMLLLPQIRIDEHVKASISYVMYLPMMTAAGKICQVKIISRPLLTALGQITTTFLSWYNVLLDFVGQPVHSYILPEGKFSEQYQQSLSGVFDLLNYTIRERRVIALTHEGYSKTDISEQLQVTIRTIEKYNQNILRKTRELFGFGQLSSTKEAVLRLSIAGMNMLNDKSLKNTYDT